MNQERFRYGYNGIEELTDFGLNLNHTTFRLHDPALGRWNSVDPKADLLMGLSPYNSMGNSPLMYSDPNGDIFGLGIVASAALIGAAVGGTANVVSHWDDITKNGFNLGTAAGAFAIGAGGGAAAGAIGVGAAGAGFFAGLGYGAVSGVAGDAITQIGNGLAFGDAYNGKQTLYAGLLGGAIGGATGYFTAGSNVNPWTGNPITETIDSKVGLTSTNLKPYDGPDYMWSGDDLGDIYSANSKAGPGVTVLGSDPATLANASRLVPEKGLHQLLVHGHFDKFIINGAITSPKTVARTMLQSGFERGTPIRCISCHTGRFSDGAAYRLSRYLKSPVLAPTDKVRILEGGHFDIFGKGTWKQF